MFVRQAAARFGVGMSNAIRWIARARLGELAPPASCAETLHRLADRGRKDITLNEMVELLESEQSVRISGSAVSA
ncbi:MAG: hypothetical protein E5Y63_06195 [Mesorhizobium sp.]|nr:MAG: hypothetical protein E5Y63_06195 [Mesorhizobium sp.]